MLKIAENWNDYELIDAGNKEKIERWNDIILLRPDPIAIWEKEIDTKKVDAIYHRSKSGGGSWEYKRNLPEFWTINYRGLTFKVSPTNFKHTGIFPEQAYNWDWMMDMINSSNRPIKVLNLFAYTGCASMCLSYAGASEVVHLDASKGIINWAKENMYLSHLENNKIRFIVDDAKKFILREIRRGNKYDAILMDPPSYGRGPNNELFKLENEINDLIKESIKLLSDNPLFFLVNSYTAGFSSIVLDNIFKQNFRNGKIETGELGLNITNSGLVLPCGIYGKWTNG